MKSPVAFGQLIRRTEAEALVRAQEIIARAQEKADQLLREAERAAAERHLVAESEAEARAVGKLAARAIRLTQREKQSDRQQLERTISMATLLAERLLGEILSITPTRIQALAREVLLEVHGAQHVVMAVHPEDESVLREYFAHLDASEQACRIIADASLQRGQFKLETDIGSIDANLGERLQCLAEQLRESLA